MFDNVRLVKTLDSLTSLEPTLESLVEEMRVLQQVVTQMESLREELAMTRREMSRTTEQLETLNAHVEEVLEQDPDANSAP